MHTVPRRKKLRKVGALTGKRIHERYERRIRVLISFEEQSYEAVTRNISTGGMLIATTAPVPMGARVELNFHLPGTKQPIECGAHVRWKKPDGVGVQFDGLRAKYVWTLNKFLKRESQASEG